MLLNEPDAKRTCDKLLSYLRADDAVVRVRSNSDSHVRFASNTITTNGSSEETSVQVTVWVNQKRGEASGNEMSDAALRRTVEQAEQIARVSPVDQEYVPSLGPQTFEPVDGYVDATANIVAADRARSMAQVTDACEKAKVSGYGFHQAGAEAAAFASKNGNFNYSRSSNVSFALTVRTPDGAGSGFFQRDHFDVARLDLGRISSEAIRKAVESHAARPLPPGVYSVILEPQAVSDLLAFFSFDFDARRADEGRSPFAAPGGKTRLGEKLFDERISLYSDPWHPDVPASAATREHIPAVKIFLIRNGVVANLTYSRFWASKKETQPTPGPVNSILEGTGEAASMDAMIKAMQRGLLVSRFWYIRTVNPRTASFTGLTRDGVWYIEDGAIRYPVRNFRFNQSLLEMLAPGNVEQIGTPERIGDNTAMPALQLKEFHFTSESDAV